MTYCFCKTIEMGFEEAEARIRALLEKQGFGILTEVDMKAMLKRKLDVDFREYKILGACNPPFAHQALQIEDKIGLMLPCNVVIQESGRGKIEVAIADPAESMKVIGNPRLKEVAEVIRLKLETVLQSF